MAEEKQQKRPTFKQMQALKAIRGNELTDGWQMTIRELARRLGLKTTATHERVRLLRAKGLLVDRGSIELTDLGRKVADGGAYGV